MAQSRLLAPLRVLGSAITASTRSTTAIPQPQTLLTTTPKPTTSLPRFHLLPFSPVRHASHAAQGTANKHKTRPAGKRLGAKRTNGEYVVPGCILFKQRGTTWYPGENCAFGRDHTIFAMQPGYVRYYRDPAMHPDRKYIGIALDKNGVLPRPLNAPTRRRLGMALAPRLPDRVATAPVSVTAGEPSAGAARAPGVGAADGPQLRPGYMWRESNWQIGRAAENAGVKVRPFNKKDGFAAAQRKKAAAEHEAKIRSLTGKVKGGKKKGKKGRA
jgi:large subunit ribosomal protein L27